MSRQLKLEESFLFEGFEIDGKQIFPLAANRRTFLRKMGNPLFSGGDVEDEGESTAEALLACTLRPPELGSYLARKEDWQERVTAFIFNLDDFAIERFQAALQAEVEALQLSSVEPLGKDQTP